MKFYITVSECSFESVRICLLLAEMRICFSFSDVWTC